MRIGILITGHMADEMRATHGDDYSSLFLRLLAGQGLDFTSYRVVDGAFPPSPEAQEGWLITGSRHGTYDDLPWIAPLEAFLRAARAADRPMVGICFGHQIMATAFGGTCEKYPGGWALGPHSYRMRNGQRRNVIAWHQDQVTRPPDDAEVIGGSEFCRNAYLLYGHAGYSMQPHPEFDPGFTRDLLQARRDILPPDRAASAEANMCTPLDTATNAAEIAHFFKTRTLP